MNGTLLLVAGVGTLFCGVVLLAVTSIHGSPERRQISTQLKAVRMAQGSPLNLRAQQLQTPFADRALTPLLQRVRNLGRRITPQQRLDAIRRRLDLAGNPMGWDLDRVLGLKVLALACGGVLGLVGCLMFRVSTLSALVLVPTSAVVGWAAPGLWLYQVAYNRSERVRNDLADALDLLSISMEAGLGFDAALAQVAHSTDGPLSQEFFRVLQEMQIGTGRADALRALADRTDVEELRSFLLATVQADGYGIPLARVLRVQSREMRVKRSQRAEERAQKVPVKILLPLIFCILPALFIVVMGPAALTVMNNFGSR